MRRVSVALVSIHTFGTGVKGVWEPAKTLAGTERLSKPITSNRRTLKE
jgi:hypothetical protein